MNHLGAFEQLEIVEPVNLHDIAESSSIIGSILILDEASSLQHTGLIYVKDRPAAVKVGLPDNEMAQFSLWGATINNERQVIVEHHVLSARWQDESDHCAAAIINGGAVVVDEELLSLRGTRHLVDGPERRTVRHFKNMLQGLTGKGDIAPVDPRNNAEARQTLQAMAEQSHMFHNRTLAAAQRFLLQSVRA